MPKNHATKPSGTGPGTADRDAAGILGMAQVLHVRRDVAQLLVVEDARSEHRHLSGAGTHRGAHLQRLGVR